MRQKIISIFMIIILLSPNVYCLENVEASEDAVTESSQTASKYYEENNDNTLNEKETGDTTSAVDSESLDEYSELSEIDSVPLAVSSSEDEIYSLGNLKAHLSPALENENDYFDTSLFTGSFVYTYPIETTKGRAGLEPNIFLTYSSISGSKGTHGSLGMGWLLNDNCIIRDTKYTAENTNDDEFILILDGSNYKLVYTEEDSYHTKTESFLNITKTTTNTNSFGEYWSVKTSDGTTYRFGFYNDSEQRNSIDSRNYVSKWWLDQIEDVNGNQIQYNYIENPDNEEVGSTYLDNITYNDGLSIISFVYTKNLILLLYMNIATKLLKRD
ncbi:SpvB/TcaC N-terminal domain-containing protein [Methanolobus psychrotolerans]|uniref:SpvB/TcaC N-terminal domain-containing protein n=1 Tax=Methanolobus psychrotolerans TaxID=1874706 RepID=UPI000B9155F1|nr:SpvB/TcaC N-terminal domain-containing protein [Methanolobus psychrotolerans]